MPFARYFFIFINVGLGEKLCITGWCACSVAFRDTLQHGWIKCNGAAIFLLKNPEL